MWGTNRRITPVVTAGVNAMNIPAKTMFELHKMAATRWVADNNDYFTMIRLKGIHVEITNGNEVIETRQLSEFEGITEPLFIIVDDYGEKSQEGLVITILKPDEY